MNLANGSEFIDLQRRADDLARRLEKHPDFTDCDVALVRNIRSEMHRLGESLARIATIAG